MNQLFAVVHVRTLVPLVFRAQEEDDNPNYSSSLLSSKSSLCSLFEI